MEKATQDEIITETIVARTDNTVALTTTGPVAATSIWKRTTEYKKQKKQQ